MLENGVYGPRALVTGPWNNVLEQALKAEHIAELELNYAKGWHGNRLTFLSEFPDLSAFEIVDRTIQDVSPVHFLKKLRAMRILTHCITELRFSEFPFLIDCGLEWRPKAMSLFESTELRHLFINRYTGTNTDSFAKLLNLESLVLLGGPISSLEGLGALAKLRSLRLGDLRKLKSLEGIQNLTELKSLEINTCRAIESIDQLSQLTNLEELYLNNLGKIRSLKPLIPLKRLMRFTFSESTEILDGDLSPLLSLPNLGLVSFQNRKHYSHKREDFLLVG